MLDERTRLRNTTVARIVAARGSLSDDGVKKECCVRLQKINAQLKDRVAELDATMARDAMHAGILKGGFSGCDNSKLIAVLCTRTKASLERTKKAYRGSFDRDLTKDVKSKTGSDYGRMMGYALSRPDEYVADVIHAACHGMGCDEDALIELCMTRSPEQLEAGKRCWEGRRDKALYDYLGKELGRWYKDLKHLILEILKGHRCWDGPVDEKRAAHHAERLHHECKKNMMQNFHEDKVVDYLLAGPPAETQLVCELYEDAYDTSLKKSLEAKCGKKFYLALSALLVPPEEFLAMRLEKAMKGWGADDKVLIRILGGLDHASKPSMAQVAGAYERKYTRTLKDALRANIKGNFLRASVAWVDALTDPAQHLEAKTSIDVDSSDDLDTLLDDLLVEHNSVECAMADADAQEIYNCCHGWGTSDGKLIALLCSRSKPHLQKVAAAYYEQRDKPLLKRLRSETTGWYRLFMTYLVESPEDADVRALDSAMDGIGADAVGLIEFLVGRSQARVRAAKAKWEGKHDKPLVDRIRSELHGSNRTLALELLKGERNETAPVDERLATNQADQLHKGVSRWGSADDEAFIQILSKNSPAQNAALRTAYEKKYSRSLESQIAKVGQKNLKKCLQALLLPPADYYAMRIRQAFVGLGTSDKVVCRVLGGSDKCDALAIAAAYQRKYTTVLKDGIKKECSGNYKQLAQAWVTLPDALEDPEVPIDVIPDTQNEDDVDVPDDPDPPTRPPSPPPPPLPARPVQPVAVAAPVQQAVYEHQDSRGVWTTYDPQTAAILEAAVQSNPNAVVRLPGIPFEVRFGSAARSARVPRPPPTGALQVNVNGENSRVVRRRAAGPAPPAYQAPPPPTYQAPPHPPPVHPRPAAVMPAGTFPVLVPAGHGPGMQLMVRAPNTGQSMTVIIPQGVGPGGQFAVPLPQQPVYQQQQNWRRGW